MSESSSIDCGDSVLCSSRRPADPPGYGASGGASKAMLRSAWDGPGERRRSAPAVATVGQV